MKKRSVWEYKQVICKGCKFNISKWVSNGNSHLYQVGFINSNLLVVGNCILHVTLAKKQREQFIRHDLQWKVSMSRDRFHIYPCLQSMDISPLVSVLTVVSAACQPLFLSCLTTTAWLSKSVLPKRVEEVRRFVLCRYLEILERFFILQ